ncbi:MAG TPA: hypothetical protein VK843_10370, partial [Planctomycetota bacterium]|nr:hypothetical protein [Planctomycetota bacterium]
MLLVPCLANVADAQLASNDLLVNMYGVNARIERFRADGTHLWTSTGGTGSDWEGSAVTAQGHVITTRRNPQAGVNVFDLNGAQISNFLTPQVPFAPGDVGVFSDGTLAVVNQGGTVELYTEAGAFVSSMLTTGALHPFGCFVDSHDQLFLCDTYGPGRITKLSPSGQLLANFPVTFIPGDLVVAPDETLWVTDRINKYIVHLDAAGAVLAQFQVAVIGYCSSIAMAGDGTFFTSGESSMQIFHYSSAGTLLGTIPIPGPVATPLFLTIGTCGVDPAPYCTAKVNSVSCTPAITFQGAASASA